MLDNGVYKRPNLRNQIESNDLLLQNLKKQSIQMSKPSRGYLIYENSIKEQQQSKRYVTDRRGMSTEMMIMGSVKSINTISSNVSKPSLRKTMADHENQKLSYYHNSVMSSDRDLNNGGDSVQKAIKIITS